LRPGGRVLDIHPEPEAASIEVAAHGSLTRIGPFDRPAIYDNIVAARDALAELVDRGLFDRERSISFEVLYHFDSVEAWLAYRAERGSSTVVPPELQERARELLAQASGELLIREQMRATRYRRRAAPPRKRKGSPARDPE
jgi:hypothetical protein